MTQYFGCILYLRLSFLELGMSVNFQDNHMEMLKGKEVKYSL